MIFNNIKIVDDTKTNLRTSINRKGVRVSEYDKFLLYPAKIDEIDTSISEGKINFLNNAFYNFANADVNNILKIIDENDFDYATNMFRSDSSGPRF